MRIPDSIFLASVRVRNRSVRSPVADLTGQNGDRSRRQEGRALDLLLGRSEALGLDAQRVESETSAMVYNDKIFV